MNYRGTRAGTRKAVPYENPERRRVNAIGILLADGPEPMLIWDRVPRSLTSQDLLTVLQDVPQRNGRLIVVLDNGSMHVSHVIQDARPALKAPGIEFSDLPPYRPELNAIEPVFGGIKHHGLPARRYPEVNGLMEAFDQAFTEAEARLLARRQCLHQLSPAAHGDLDAPRAWRTRCGYDERRRALHPRGGAMNRRGALPMAVGVIFSGSGVTQAQYEQVNQAVAPDNRLPPGMQYHAAGPVEGGWRVMEVWESQEALDRFFRAHLGAALQQAGIDVQPEFFPIHHIMQP